MSYSKNNKPSIDFKDSIISEIYRKIDFTYTKRLGIIFVFLQKSPFMKKIVLLLCIIAQLGIAQESSFFYATMDAIDAQVLSATHPSVISIISSNDKEAVVYINDEGAQIVHENVLQHGPGYVYKSTLEDALESLSTNVYEPQRNAVFTIDQEGTVEVALEVIDPAFIEADILALQAYGTRYHTRPSAEQAVLDLKDKWEAMIADYGRTDISVQVVTHVNTPMPSLILTFQGNDFPDDYIIVGGHIDSINHSNNDDAPGADDNASGIATLTEMLRALLAVGYLPEKTVEIMAFAAEEIGLVGSAEIAQQYATENKNVLAMVQFDMTNYQGSTADVYITEDDYNSSNLNGFLISLMDYYNSSGDHQFTYATTVCNYGCSDHYSWAQQGFETAFPFESSFGEHNNNIHTSNDLYSVSGTANHAEKFAKLGVEFIIEAAKSVILDVPSNSKNAVQVFVNNNRLHGVLGPRAGSLSKISLYDVVGKRVLDKNIINSSFVADLSSLNRGFYIVLFHWEDGSVTSQKIGY